MRSLAKTATVALLLVTAGNAGAFEYPLQFAPGVDYQDLVVAGYEVAGKTIVGNCSFVQIVSGSGKDPKPTYVPVPETCTWSLFGALLGVAAGAPSVPAPVAVHGTQTIYARKSAHLYTGTDSALSEGGFVFTYGAHEDWLTPSGPMVLPQQPYSFTATLSSDGDTPLRVTRVTAHTAIAKGPDNPATKVKIDNTHLHRADPGGRHVQRGAHLYRCRPHLALGAGLRHADDPSDHQCRRGQRFCAALYLGGEGDAQ